jgi:8-oxo-dGTP diphosphatase
MEIKTRKRATKSSAYVGDKSALGIGVGVILLNHSTPIPAILLGRRISPNGFGNGEWSLPGGKLDYLKDENRFESTKEAAIREVFEETDLRIKNLCRVYFSDDFFPAVGKQFVTVYYTAEVDLESVFWSIKDVVNKEPEKCSEWKLFPINMLPSPLFCGVEDALEFWSWSKEISVIEAIIGGGKEAATAYFEPIIRLRGYFNQLRIKKTKEGGISLVKKIDAVKQAAIRAVPTGIRWPLRKKNQK